MTDYKNLLIEKKDSILIVTINRERALNALNKDTVHELQQLINYHWTDLSLSAVILTGAGDKAFVAGADIPELADLDVRSGAELAAHGQYLMKSLQNFPLPVIAAINGFALGGGCEIAMACDIRLASEKAKFGQPEVNLGIIPGYGGTQRLPRLVGRGKAMQLILTGSIISAAEAYRIGLVDEIYPAEELMDKALEMANLIAAKGPLAVRMAKECVNRGLETTLTAGCDLEKANFGSICGTGDKNEGMEAFLEKRAAKFTGH
ncbi:MAG: enoyl-CoA hydratase/isomerase family protein [candidate division Zixibacteria bacterium]|nr:enoyl-CoA hydratase/isomerase family protein [candidate division Zixibacteria bacterium]